MPPPGCGVTSFSRCLPTAWLPVWVGSHTETTIVLTPPRSSRSVMSYEKESYPPSWTAPAWRSLTQTVVRQSTAPKCSWTRRPSQPAGTVKARRYHSLSSWVIRRWMPESADSAANGTRICSGNVVGRPAFAEVTAKSQMPLRFAQSGRVSCGRGYSGSGLSTGTWFVHGVVIGAGLGVHAARRRGGGAGNGEGGAGQQGQHRQDGRRPPPSRAGGGWDGCGCSTHRHSSGSGVGDVRVREAAGCARA